MVHNVMGSFKYPNNSDEVIVYETKSHHNYDEFSPLKEGVSKEAKFKIQELHKLHLKLNTITETLKQNSIIIKKEAIVKLTTSAERT